MILRKPVVIEGPGDAKLAALYDTVHMAFARAGAGSKPPRQVQVGIDLWSRVEDNGEIIYTRDRALASDMVAYNSVSMGERPDGVRVEEATPIEEEAPKVSRRNRKTGDAK